MFWTVTATATYKNHTFVVSAEHKASPIIGIQFQPEKMGYEWTTLVHTSQAVDASRALFDTFVKKAKMNGFRFKNSKIEYNSLIYKSKTTYTWKDLEYMEVYFDPCVSSGTRQVVNSIAFLSTVLLYKILYFR